MTNADIHKSLLDSLSGGICAVNRDRVITYWNKNTETLTGYKNSDTVGRCCRDDILMYVDDQGRGVCENECMATGTMNDGNPRSMEVYAHHKDGYRVPVLVRILPLKNLDGQVIGAIEELYDNSSKIEYTHKIEELEKCALLDSLTGLMKRRGLEMNLRTMFGVMHRYGWSYGVFLVDIDGFKRINDLYGAKIGDAVLKMVSKTLLNSVRATDMVGRWGGEEFMVIAMNVTENHLQTIANKIRILIKQSGFFAGADAIRVTVSVSATVARSNDNVDTLLKRVNQLMHQAKSSGKNCVSV
ncbi:MAG: sensor domain-containing diguanylate cyclase [Candidatus Brocadia sp. WS118]|nr:MAG: sensor domain-containing diguanylate cyclase [Candidatus Brocadia sp. WS118]